MEKAAITSKPTTRRLGWNKYLLTEATSDLYQVVDLVEMVNRAGRMYDNSLDAVGDVKTWKQFAGRPRDRVEYLETLVTTAIQFTEIGQDLPAKTQSAGARVGDNTKATAVAPFPECVQNAIRRVLVRSFKSL
jgi:hypothetical protein